jgi:transcriptional regulator with XRE-family HTH domain
MAEWPDEQPGLVRLNGDKINQLRRERGLTEKDLANEAGISHGTLRNILAGKAVYLETRNRIAAALGVTVAEITLQHLRWVPEAMTPLLPAKHFAGRDRLLTELQAWVLHQSPNPSATRVWATRPG